jgi:ligand-binding SRPBCC domain-containing protein
MGEMSVLALSSCKVMPKVAVDSGFRFGFPSLAEALSDLCSPPKRGRFDKLVYEQWIPKKVDEIFPFFAEAKNLEVITPPWLEFNVLGASTPDMREGTLIDYKLKLHGVNVRWQSRIESWEPNKKFVDFQTRGPYSYWHHTHEFKPMGEGTLMIDRIEYGLPMGSLGRAVAGWKVDRDLEQIFSFRKQKIDELFAAKE